MTQETMIQLLSSYTEQELQYREQYYYTNSVDHLVPPLPPDIRRCPEHLTPDAIYRPESTIAPYRHERFRAVEYHDHQHVELMYQFSGCCSNAIEGKTTLLNAQDVCILPPGVYHLPQITDDNSIMLNIMIQTDTLYRVCQNFTTDNDHPLSRFVRDLQHNRNYPTYYFQRGCSDKLANLICELNIEYIENRSYSDICLENLLTAIFCDMFRSPPEQSEISSHITSANEPILPILQYVYNNYRTVTLAELSEKFRYTPQHLCRMFKMHIGHSFSQHLQELRITRAKQLLDSTDYPIQHIAELSGFDCVPYFHRKFKMEVGCTPTEYREQFSHVQPSP